MCPGLGSYRQYIPMTPYPFIYAYSNGYSRFVTTNPRNSMNFSYKEMLMIQHAWIGAYAGVQH